MPFMFSDPANIWNEKILVMCKDLDFCACYILQNGWHDNFNFYFDSHHIYSVQYKQPRAYYGKVQMSCMDIKQK